MASSYHGTVTAVPEEVGVSAHRLGKLEEWQKAMVDEDRLPNASMQMYVTLFHYSCTLVCVCARVYMRLRCVCRAKACSVEVTR